MAYNQLCYSCHKRVEADNHHWVVFCSRKCFMNYLRLYQFIPQKDEQKDKISGINKEFPFVSVASSETVFSATTELEVMDPCEKCPKIAAFLRLRSSMIVVKS